MKLPLGEVAREGGERGMEGFSPLRIMFDVGLSYIAFIMLRYVPSFCFSVYAVHSA